MEKFIFKVGDRPEWTVDLIKRLPHGTVLECAWKQTPFEYSGEQPDYDKPGHLTINKKSGIGTNQYEWFFDHDTQKHAKILSLPESYLKPFKPEVDVTYSIRKIDCEDPDLDDYKRLSVNIVINDRLDYKEIRKIQPDPDNKLAKEILENWGLLEDGKCLPNLVCAVIEAIKKGRGE